MSDSTIFDMTDVPLAPALEIAFSISPSRKAWGYKSTPERLTFAWNERAGEDFIPFLVPIDATYAVALVRQWIAEVAKFPAQPDHDGNNGKSCRIFTEGWGFVDHNHYAFVAVEPRWAMYGK